MSEEYCEMMYECERKKKWGHLRKTAGNDRMYQILESV